MDHIEDFYRPKLQKLGYSIEFTYRRNRDAVLVGFKSEEYELLEKEVVDYNDLGIIFKDDVFEKNNKAIICLLRHVKPHLNSKFSPYRSLQAKRYQ